MPTNAKITPISGKRFVGGLADSPPFINELDVIKERAAAWGEAVRRIPPDPVSTGTAPLCLPAATAGMFRHGGRPAPGAWLIETSV
jgi:hypothetical protein